MEYVVLYSLFILFSFLAAVEPGPGFVSLSVNTARHGRAGGCCNAFGFFLGALPYIFLVAGGLSLLINTIPGLLSLLKTLAAIYLLWLAINMLRNSRPDQSLEMPELDGSKMRSGRLMVWPSFWSGFLLVILNPRTMVFYSTFLPLFFSESLGLAVSTQFLFLGIGVAVIFLITDLIFVSLIYRFRGHFKRNPVIKSVFNYFGSAILAIVGAKLLLDSK